MNLAKEFEVHFPKGVHSPETWTQLEGVLLEVLAKCRETWPALDVPVPEFMAYLAARVPEAQPLPTAIPSIHVSDLYLACGCLRGDRVALCILEEHYIAALSRAAFGSVPRAKERDELAQQLRVRLLTGDEGSPPRLGSYSGRAPLKAWLRIVAARLTVDLHRSEKRQSEEAWPIHGKALDPELVYVKQHYADAFVQALESGLNQLPRRPRTVLRLHFVESVPIAKIATSYRVSARTVQRWVVSAQQEILEHVRVSLAQQLQLSSSQWGTLLTALRGDLQSALLRFFNAEGSTAQPRNRE